MSLSNIMSNAASGLMASQAGLRATSDNMSNVNTVGYARKIIQQTSSVSAGQGSGVTVTGVRRITSQFLQTASLNAASNAARHGVLATSLDNVQSLFGDPSETSSFFGRVDKIMASFSNLAGTDVTSPLLRGAAVNSMQDFLDDAKRIRKSIDQQSADADANIQADIDRVNVLLKQIDSLNGDIARAQSGADHDATGSENLQSQLLDELSTLMDVNITPRTQGGVVVRSSDGSVALAGQGYAVLSYNSQEGADGYISAKAAQTNDAPVKMKIDSGEIRGLLDLRNVELPQVREQLGEMVSRTAESLNRAANASTAVPAPNSLTGRKTGLDLATAVGGFQGVTNIAVVDSAGVVQRNLVVDFDAQEIRVGGVTTAFGGDFAAALTTAMGGDGTASYDADGALTLKAADGFGVAVADDAANPATKAGKGFSHFFGLNDVVRGPGPGTYETGMTGSDPHGFADGSIKLRITDGSNLKKEVTVNVTAGGTMDDLLGSMNAQVGTYGTFSLNDYGEMVFTPKNGAQVSVLSDSTARDVGGMSMSDFFGIGAYERGERASAYVVNPDLVADTGRMPTATLDLSKSPALQVGDTSGAIALSKAGDVAMTFSAAGGAGASKMTLSNYAAQLAGSIGRRASAADTARDSAAAVQLEADSRRQTLEGVNLDEELVNMTTYQQSYNASARLIQAAKEMFDTLTSMI